MLQVIQGLLQANEAVVVGKDNCAQLFAHEVTRVFHDRLVCPEDRRTFFEILSDNLHDYFKVTQFVEILFLLTKACSGTVTVLSYSCFLFAPFSIYCQACLFCCSVPRERYVTVKTFFALENEYTLFSNLRESGMAVETIPKLQPLRQVILLGTQTTLSLK